MTTPFFSIVMPVWNRRAAVRRAIDSCLAQDFASFEILAVDDGSSDGSVEAIGGYTDPRVRLLLHRVNRGVCPARNTAIRASRGEWLIFLDSDHEMLPGCLSRIHQHAAPAGDDVHRFGFQYLFDDGRISPSLLPSGDALVGYSEWLLWIDRAQWTDALWATRRHCFSRLLLPESFALEFSYFLDFAKHYQSRMIPLTLAYQHTDAADRLSYMIPAPDPGLARRKALDQAADWEYVLAEHGGALQRHAPRQFQAVLRNLAVSSLLAGNRRRGIAASLRSLMLYPMSFSAWATASLVLAGGSLTRLVAKMRSRKRQDEAVHPRRSLTGISQSATESQLS